MVAWQSVGSAALEGIEEHVEAAIRAAQAAFPAWSALTAAERKPILDRFADESSAGSSAARSARARTQT